jgi:hypothetical protein
MAQPFVKIPGARDRALKNAVPGLRRKGAGGRRVYGAVLGISTEVQERRRKLGRFLGSLSLTLAVLFLLGGVLRVIMLESDLARQSVQTVFAILGVVSAIGVHLLLFAADALRGRDAPRAVWAVLIFWVSFFLFGLW